MTTGIPEGTRPFPWGRNREPKINPVGEFVSLTRGDRTYLGEVTETYRDEDEVLYAKVKHFNGEPWPIDAPVGCLLWIAQDWQTGGDQ